MRKEPPTPRSAAAASRLESSSHVGSSTASSSSSRLGPLIPFKPGQTSLRKQAILTEDEYTSALSAIIKRDFFPDLDRIAAENEYLSAVESEDQERIRTAFDRLLCLDGSTVPQRLARKLRRTDAAEASSVNSWNKGEWDDTPVATGPGAGSFNPTFTPAASTPHADGEEEAGIGLDGEDGQQSGITPDLDLSLADFQARYTSEDNASFSQLLERDSLVRKRKHAHLFAREQASAQNRQFLTQAEQAEAKKGRQLAIEANPDHPKLLQQGRPTLAIEGSRSEDKDKERSAATPADTKGAKDPMDDLILVPEPRREDRPTPTGLARWKYTARNALMYGPDANVSALYAPASSTPPNGDGGERKPGTNFSAIRLPEDAAPNDEMAESEAGWSPSSSRVNAAIQRGRAGSFASSSDAGTDTPKVNGYGFVTPYSTPQHHSVGENVDEAAHLRIYNAIKAKRRTDSPHASVSSTGEESVGRQFELPNLNKREKLALKLTPTASPKARVAGGATPYGMQKYTGLAGLRSRAFASPRAAGRTTGTLTPAAKALLDRSTRGLTPSKGSAFATPSPPHLRRGSQRTESRVGDRGWTPTPQHTQRRPP